MKILHISVLHFPVQRSYWPNTPKRLPPMTAGLEAAGASIILRGPH
jgi:hypothetical protein